MQKSCKSEKSITFARFLRDDNIMSNLLIKTNLVLTIKNGKFKNIQPVEDFNWDALLKKGDSYGEVSKDDLVKTYDETLNTVKDKEVVMGTVTAMNKREVVVNIGFKSDGVVSMAEFRYNPDLKIGDEVEVYIENQEDKEDS